MNSHVTATFTRSIIATVPTNSRTASNQIAFIICYGLKFTAAFFLPIDGQAVAGGQVDASVDG